MRLGVNNGAPDGKAPRTALDGVESGPHGGGRAIEEAASEGRASTQIR